MTQVLIDFVNAKIFTLTTRLEIDLDGCEFFCLSQWSPAEFPPEHSKHKKNFFNFNAFKSLKDQDIFMFHVQR